MSDRMNMDDFRKCLGSSCRVSDSQGAEVILEMLEVTPLGSEKSDPGIREQAFSVLFGSDSSEVLPQSIYTLDLPRLGPLDLFLVPVGEGSRGVRYEAVFT